MSTNKNKDQAEFQSNYNSSKNFNTTAKDEHLEPASKGDVKLSVNDNLKESDKKKIADAMDSMRRGLENTDERVAQREEE